jgi:hypothetical protein
MIQSSIKGCNVGTYNPTLKCGRGACLFNGSQEQDAFRPALDPKGTLSSILTIKLAHTEAAHQFEPNKELLKTAKSATRVYNRAHCSK